MAVPVRSTFSKAQHEQIQEQLVRLVRGTLQQGATPENLATAVPWCNQRLREHRFLDTDSNEVNLEFRRLLEKLRAHSQLEAADYLKVQHAAFLRCKISRRYSLDSHAAVLRVLLLLARQPTQVPPRVVRSLRAICEGRRQRAAQQRLQVSEQAYDRKLLMELELRQVAEGSCHDWDAAWSGAPDWEDLVPAEDWSELQGKHDGQEEEDVDEGEDDWDKEIEEDKDVAEACPKVQHRGLALPRGSLPKQPWQQALAGDAKAVPVTEQAVVQMALQMLSGHVGELLEVAHDGQLRWRALAMAHLSAPALDAALQPLAELGSALRQLRSLSSLLQAIAPPLGNSSPLRAALAQVLSERSLLGIGVVAQLWEAESLLPRKDDGHGDDEGHLDGREAADKPQVFGLCWYSMGLELEELLSESAARLEKVEAQMHTNNVDSGLDEDAPVTLMRLVQQLEPQRRSVLAALQALDNALTALSRQCWELPSAGWPKASAEELLAHLSRAACSQDLSGNQASGAWLGPLWCGAARPLLRAMDEWGTVGEVHDPCGEFWGGCAEGQTEPDLMPRPVAIAGRQVRSLHGWSQNPRSAALSRPRGSAAELTSLRQCLGGCYPHAEVTDLATYTSSGSSCRRRPQAFVPFEASLEARVLGPMRQISQAAARPLLLRVLEDGEHGLLRHLASLRLIAFLERESAVGPLMSRLFAQLRRMRRLPGSPLRGASDSLANELNAALAEGLDAVALGSGSRALRGRRQADSSAHSATLCARHLVLGLAAKREAGLRVSPAAASADPLEDPLDRLRLLYSVPPPLDRVLDAKAMQGYSAILALLLRVRYAQTALMEVHELPIFGFGSNGRLTGARQVESLAPLARRCDLLRAELGHFLGCVESYIRRDVLQKESQALQKRLRLLAAEAGEGLTPGSLKFNANLRLQSSSPSPEESGIDFHDTLERARQLHGEHLSRILQACLLAPELSSVLSDLERLLRVAVQLRDVLEKLLRKLPGFVAAQKQSQQLKEPGGGRRAAATEDGSEDEDGDETEDSRSEWTDVDVEETLRAELESNTEKVARLQRDFRGGVRYLLQVLTLSVARGAAPQVASLCAQLNFSGFYTDDI
ncbi:unnamed protein product [Polarella glacialis]|uniref:Gamma tubulin complex component C-terminal domain-containing protein n=1 Tax=Polarella glacialis TaxID=89957 RepID=A0A813GQV9_POLGL|nr:unnamed protein product [Polarella glacialis]